MGKLWITNRIVAVLFKEKCRLSGIPGFFTRKRAGATQGDILCSMEKNRLEDMALRREFGLESM